MTPPMMDAMVGARVADLHRAAGSHGRARSVRAERADRTARSHPRPSRVRTRIGYTLIELGIHLLAGRRGAATPDGSPGPPRRTPTGWSSLA